MRIALIFILLFPLVFAVLWAAFMMTLDTLDLNNEFRDWILAKLNAKTLDK